MAKAQAYLAENDLLQASEKGWGAAAQMVKAAAEMRGWPHKNHGHLFTTINRLVDETGDRDLAVLFHSAHSLHINFYEGWMPRRSVEVALSQVQKAGGEAGAACLADSTHGCDGLHALFSKMQGRVALVLDTFQRRLHG